MPAYSIYQVSLTASFYLACKLTEEPRKIRDILNVVLEAINLRSRAPRYVFYSQSSTRFLDPHFSLPLYTKAREEVIKAERILLRLVHYDLSLPVKLRECFARTVRLAGRMGLPPTTIQIAWSLLNDILM